MKNIYLAVLCSFSFAAAGHASVIYTVENTFSLTTANYIQSGSLQFGAPNAASSGLGSNYRSSSCFLASSFTCWQAAFYQQTRPAAPPQLQNSVAIQFTYLGSGGEQHWSELDFPGASLTEDGIYYQYPWSSNLGLSLIVHDPIDPAIDSAVDEASALEPATSAAVALGLFFAFALSRRKLAASRT